MILAMLIILDVALLALFVWIFSWRAPLPVPVLVPGAEIKFRGTHGVKHTLIVRNIDRDFDGTTTVTLSTEPATWSEV